MNLKSKLCLGSAQFGMDYGIMNSSGKLSMEEIIGIINIASLEGIRKIDTSQVYGDAEGKIGYAIQNENLRNMFEIVTKVPGSQINHFDVSVNYSLERLRCKNLYGVLYHEFKSFINNKETIIKLENLKQKGIIKKFGFSLYHPEEAEFILNNKIPIDILQFPYNLFDRRFEPLFNKIKDKGIEIYVRSVFLQGLLLMNPEKLDLYFENIKHKIVHLNRVSQIQQVDTLSICLNFVLLNPHIDYVIIGIDSSIQMKNNINAINNALKVKNILKQLDCLVEYNEKIILPFNWPQK